MFFVILWIRRSPSPKNFRGGFMKPGGAAGSSGVFIRWWSISATIRLSKRGSEPHGLIFWPELATVVVFGRYGVIMGAITAAKTARRRESSLKPGRDWPVDADHRCARKPLISHRYPVLSTDSWTRPANEREFVHFRTSHPSSNRRRKFVRPYGCRAASSSFNSTPIPGRSGGSR